GRQGDAEFGHHVAEGLGGKGGFVAAAIEANHQTVTHQLVGTHTGNAGDVFNAFSLSQGAAQQRGHQNQCTFHGGYSLPLWVQNGHQGDISIRLNQPCLVALFRPPRPPKEMRASATLLDITVLLGLMSCGRIRPAMRMYSSPSLKVSQRSPRMRRMPLGIMSDTVTLICPCRLLERSASPLPLNSRSALSCVFRLMPFQLGTVPRILPGLMLAVEDLSAVVSADLLDWYASSKITVIISPTRRACWSVYRPIPDRKSTRLNSSHVKKSYAVFCLKKK